MGIEQFLSLLGELYEAHEWNHACAILAKDFPEEWKDIVEILRSFRLRQAYINKGGGNKSPVAHALDSEFYARNWIEKSFDTKVTIDKETIDSPTHKVDCFRNRVALEVEWNNKDPFFDRDLNNFRLLFELRAVSVGVIITRSDSLQAIFNKLGRGASYGMATTHMGKLLPKVMGGGAGGCPLLVIGITDRLYVETDEIEPEVQRAIDELSDGREIGED